MTRQEHHESARAKRLKYCRLFCRAYDRGDGPETVEAYYLASLRDNPPEASIIRDSWARVQEARQNDRTKEKT